MLIKILLIGSILAIGAWIVRGEAAQGNRLALTRLSGLAVGAAWIIAVLWPDILTTIAHRVGVGRGTDLLLYALVVVFAFSMLYYRKRLRLLEDRATTIARQVALLESQITSRVTPDDG